MSINISKLTTAADIDAAIVRAENLQSEFQYKRTGESRLLTSSETNNVSLPEKLEGIELTISALNQMLPTMATGPQRDRVVAQIASLEEDKDRLEERVDNYSILSQQDRVLDIELYQVRINTLDQYLIDLEAKKAQLLANAA